MKSGQLRNKIFGGIFCLLFLIIGFSLFFLRSQSELQDEPDPAIREDFVIQSNPSERVVDQEEIFLPEPKIQFEAGQFSSGHPLWQNGTIVHQQIVESDIPGSFALESFILPERFQHLVIVQDHFKSSTAEIPVPFPRDPWNSDLLSFLKRHEMHGDRVMVQLKSAEAVQELKAIVAPFGATVESWELRGLPNLFRVTTPRSLTFGGRELLSLFANSSTFVLRAEPDLIGRAFATIPNDTNYGSQYYLSKIDAPTVWDTRTDASTIVVAVSDTGTRITHEDLDDRLWVNPAEDTTPLDGADDGGTGTDTNNFIDDIHGWDFRNADNNPEDTFNHGTLVAGIIGAETNNSQGIAGVAWDVQLMILRWMEEPGVGSSSNAAASINYAVQNGAHILNASWGFTASGFSLVTAFADAENNDMLVVAASGNDGLDIDSAGQPFPAAYTRPNILVVGASNSDDTRRSTSNYGATSVDVFAPGTGIFSTTNSNDSSYGSLSGTSFAAPIVSGMAAVMLAEDPSLTSADLITAIKSGVDPMDLSSDPAGSSGISVTDGRVNFASAFSSISSADPEITDQPDAFDAAEGDDVSFTVAATGTATLTYQWKKGIPPTGIDLTNGTNGDGTLVSGVTGNSLSLGGVATGDAGDYYVTVTNGNSDTADSDIAALTVNTATQIDEFRNTNFGETDPDIDPDVADSANPDGDVLENLMEYSLTGNPNAFEGATKEPVVGIDGSGNIQISFNRHENDDVTYIVEVSSSPSGSWTTIATLPSGAANIWDTSGGGSVSETDNGSTRSVTVTDASAVPSTGKFIRLRVTRP